MEDILVPLIIFTACAFCFWSVYYYKNREKEKIQDTICKAIDAGQQLSPETIQALGVRSMSALGIAFLLFAQAIPDEEAPQIISGLASFPIVLGIGYFIVYRLGLKQPE